MDQITIALGDAQVQIPTSHVLRALLEKLALPPITPPGTGTPHLIPAIGSYWTAQGGIYAGVMRGVDGQPDYHLIVCADEAAEIAWSDARVMQTGAQSSIDGAANTRALLASEQDHPAAEWAASIIADGHTDFYLPGRRELALLYATVPEIFSSAWYWSSTQYAGYAAYAWCQYFGYGDQLSDGKGYELRARAVRRFTLSI